MIKPATCWTQQVKLAVENMLSVGLQEPADHEGLVRRNLSSRLHFCELPSQKPQVYKIAKKAHLRCFDAARLQVNSKQCDTGFQANFIFFQIIFVVVARSVIFDSKLGILFYITHHEIKMSL